VCFIGPVQSTKELLTLTEHLCSSPDFSGVRVTRSLVFCVVFYRSLFVLLSFFFWPLCCLSFFDLRILITPLVSSNSSYTRQLGEASPIYIPLNTYEDIESLSKLAEHTGKTWLTMCQN